MEYVYIMSLPHSGSTFLEMMIAKASEVVSLGEIRNTIIAIREKKNKDKVCAKCQVPRTECSVWSQLERRILAEKSLAKSYDIVKTEFSDDYSFMIDSSKRLKDLVDFYSGDHESLKVIFLVRDVRGWVQSIENKYKKTGVKKFSAGFIVNSWFWFFSFFRRLRYLENNGIDYMVVPYESLVFNAYGKLEEIFKFIGYEGHVNQFDGPPNSHIVEGNRMRKKFLSNSGSLKYQNDWFYDLRHTLYAPLTFPCLLLNSYIFKKYR